MRFSTLNVGDVYLRFDLAVGHWRRDSRASSACQVVAGLRRDTRALLLLRRQLQTCLRNNQHFAESL